MSCGKCGNCGTKNANHYNRDCPYPRGICHYCKCVGHNKNDCPTKTNWENFKNFYPEIKYEFAHQIIQSRSNSNMDWNWNGYIPGTNFAHHHWPSLIVGQAVQSFENDVNTFTTTDSIDIVVYNAYQLYHNIIIQKNTSFENWLKVLRMIQYIKKNLN